MATRGEHAGCRLIDAAMYGRLEEVNEAIDDGADVETRNDRGMTALMYAAFYGHVGVLRRLLEAGADPNARVIDKYGPGSSDHNSTALMQTADSVFIGNHDEVIRTLVEAGADLDLKDSHGRTALMWSTRRSPLAAKTLLELGADVDCRDNDGETALMKAVRNAEGNPVFGEACREIASMLRRHNASEKGVDTVALVHAIEAGDVDRVRELVASGADVNATGKYGTSLQQAARRGRLDIVAALLEAGADPNPSDPDRSPLLDAISHGHLPIVRRLLRDGAKLNRDAKQTKAALRDATREGHEDVVAFLKRRGARASEVATLRGVATADANQMAILVKAPADRTAQAFCLATSAAHRYENVRGATVGVSPRCYLIVQFRGHPWTLVEPYYETLDEPSALDPRLAARLSAELQTQSLHYANSDTAGCVGYHLFDRGDEIETFYRGPSEFTGNEVGEEESEGATEQFYSSDVLTFHSKRRHVDRGSIGSPCKFVSRTARELDIHIPEPSRALVKPGAEVVLLEEWDPEDIARADFVSLAPLPQPKRGKKKGHQ